MWVHYLTNRLHVPLYITECPISYYTPSLVHKVRWLRLLTANRCFSESIYHHGRYALLGWWSFRLCWQEAPTFSLNRLTRQMILRATRASAFDSIMGSAYTLSEKLPKVPLISSSGTSTGWYSFILYAPQTITASYIKHLPLKSHC